MKLFFEDTAMGTRHALKTLKIYSKISFFGILIVPLIPVLAQEINTTTTDPVIEKKVEATKPDPEKTKKSTTKSATINNTNPESTTTSETKEKKESKNDNPVEIIQKTQPVKKTADTETKKIINKPVPKQNLPLSRIESVVENPVALNNENNQKFLNINNVISQIPDFQEALIPGFKFDTFSISQPQENTTDNTVEKAQNVASGNKKPEDSLSIVDRVSIWLGDFSISQGIINTFILIFIIVIFTIYRMKGGSNRRI